MKTAIGDEALGAISQLRRLRLLDLGSNSIKGEGIRFLASLPLLERLSVANSNVNDNVVGELFSMETLRVLDLSGTPITGKCMSAISPDSNLRELNLAFTNVDDSALLSLANVQTLAKLTIYGCKAISNSAIDEFKSINPLCEIVE